MSGKGKRWYEKLLTFPGHEYTGPGTDLAEAGGPVDLLDAKSAIHDEQYGSSDISTWDADQTYIENLEESDSPVEHGIAGVFRLKQAVEYATGSDFFRQEMPPVHDKSNAGGGKPQGGKKRSADEAGFGGGGRGNEDVDGESGVGRPTATNSGQQGGVSGSDDAGGMSVTRVKEMPRTDFVLEFNNTLMFHCAPIGSGTTEGIPTITITDGAADNSCDVSLDMKLCVIPYDRIAASMTLCEYNTMRVMGSKWRALECGFSIDMVKSLTSELSNLGGTTVQNNAFDGGHAMMIHVDKDMDMFTQTIDIDNHSENFQLYEAPKRDANDPNSSHLPVMEKIAFSNIPRAVVYQEESLIGNHADVPVRGIFKWGRRRKLGYITSGQEFEYMHKYKRPIWHPEQGFTITNGTSQPFQSQAVALDQDKQWSHGIFQTSRTSQGGSLDASDVWRFGLVSENEGETANDNNKNWKKPDGGLPPDAAPYAVCAAEPIPKTDGTKMSVFFRGRITYSSKIQVQSRFPEVYWPSISYTGNINKDTTPGSGQNPNYHVAQMINHANTMPHQQLSYRQYGMNTTKNVYKC